jgi:hypothetical protein
MRSLLAILARNAMKLRDQDKVKQLFNTLRLEAICPHLIPVSKDLKAQLCIRMSSVLVNLIDMVLKKSNCLTFFSYEYFPMNRASFVTCLNFSLSLSRHSIFCSGLMQKLQSNLF